MIPYKVEMLERGATPRGIRKGYPAAAKESWRHGGGYWHRSMRRKHFTPQGAKEYGYAPRSVGYEARKQRMKGHHRPLEWSGESQRRSRIFRITGTSKYASVKMNVPGLNRRAEGERANKRLEMMTISGREAKTLTRTVNDRLIRNLKRIKRERRTKL